MIIIAFFMLGLYLQLTVRSSAQQSIANGAEQGDELGTIAGNVVSAKTGEPLKRAQVILTTDGRDSHHPRLTTTDTAGHFSINGLKAGRYDLVIYREGYIPQQYGQSDPDRAGAVLTLAARQKITDLIFRLERMAVITGRVLDEDGQPLIRASVEVVQRVRTHGGVKMETVSTGTTDDLGVYRIFDLMPGRYCVRAGSTPNEGTMLFDRDGTQDADDVQPPRFDYPTTYFPGTTDAAAASVVEVKAGDEITHMDFLLTPGTPNKTYRVKGHVANSIPGQEGASVMVMMAPRDVADAQPNMNLSAQTDRKTGAFEIHDVAPGSYTAVAVLFNGDKVRTATQDVDVTSADVDTVSLALTRGVDFSGRVTFVGNMAGAGGDAMVHLNARAMGMMFAGSSQADVRPDGSFSFNEIGDGTYSVAITSKCDECYLKSATANGVDLLDKGLVIASGAAPTSIELVYSSETGKVGGTVKTADDLPAPGALVMVVPDAGVRDGDDTSKTATTDQYGRFEIRGVPPGHYKALAWEKIDSAQYDDPDFMKPFTDKAERFEVTASATTSLELKIIPASATAESQN